MAYAICNARRVYQRAHSAAATLDENRGNVVCVYEIYYCKKLGLYNIWPLVSYRQLYYSIGCVKK